MLGLFFDQVIMGCGSSKDATSPEQNVSYQEQVGIIPAMEINENNSYKANYSTGTNGVILNQNTSSVELSSPPTNRGESSSVMSMQAPG